MTDCIRTQLASAYRNHHRKLYFCAFKITRDAEEARNCVADAYAKALSRDARVLIMDEPTAVLTEAETAVFFRQVEKLKAGGVAIVFVSHKLNEVQAIADRVTILRDGQWIDTRAADDLTPDLMAQMMVGRELSDLYPPLLEADVDADVVLEVRDLQAPGVNGVSFSLRKGEILGFSGLIGAGRTDWRRFPDQRGQA